MRRVILESPYGNSDPKIVERNVHYARLCIKDCLKRGEAPFASHLLYTQEGILDDNIPAERQWGIDAGLTWGAVAETTVVYVDLGISQGMQYGIENAKNAGRQIEVRRFLSPYQKHDSIKGPCECGATHFPEDFRTRWEKSSLTRTHEDFGPKLKKDY